MVFRATVDDKYAKNCNCKGKIFRAHVNRYLKSNKKGYVYQESMILMKKLSCPGCPKCGFFDEMLDDFISDDGSPIITNIVDQALYKLEVVNTSVDLESGICDDWDLEFLIQETKNG